MTVPNKLYCCCCARQFVHQVWDSKIMVSYQQSTFMGQNKYACIDCSEDLDENGLFPEEHYLL